MRAQQRSLTPPSPCPAQQHSLFALGDLLHAVCLGLRGAAHGGNQLLFRAQDLLCLHCNLLLTLHNLDLDLFLPNLLLLVGPLQLIGQLGLSCLWQSVVSMSEASGQVSSPKPQLRCPLAPHLDIDFLTEG